MSLSIPVLSEAEVNELVPRARDWVVAHGIVMKPATRELGKDANLVQGITVFLFPTPFPRALFEHACNVHKDFQTVMHKVSLDQQFLEQCFRRIIDVDEFTSRLMGIYRESNENGPDKPLSLGLIRNDFMLHQTQGNPLLRQIEINTISVSFGGMSHAMHQFHSYIMKQCGHDVNEQQLPKSLALDGMATGMLEAWKKYGNPKAIVVFIVIPNERNIFDQRLVEWRLQEMDSRVRVARYTLSDVAEQGTLSVDKALKIGEEEVAIVYFRSAYGPAHYTSEKDWEARLLIEKSRTVKCPSIGMQLAGSKKVQQALTQPGVVERYLGDERAALLRTTFAGQYALDEESEEQRRALAHAVKHPDLYVMKPQREGGGNNLYGDQIRQACCEDSPQRKAFVLMDRLTPPHHCNWRLDAQSCSCSTCTCTVGELGVFGFLLTEGDTELANVQSGHFMRNKAADADETGVAAGFGGLGSVLLV